MKNLVGRRLLALLVGVGLPAAEVARADEEATRSLMVQVVQMVIPRGETPLPGVRLSAGAQTSEPTIHNGSTRLALEAPHLPGQQLALLLVGAPGGAHAWALATPYINVPRPGEMARVVLFAAGAVRDAAETVAGAAGLENAALRAANATLRQVIHDAITDLATLAEASPEEKSRALAEATAGQPPEQVVSLYEQAAAAALGEHAKEAAAHLVAAGAVALSFDVSRAHSAFKRAVALDPANRDALFELALADSLLGRHADAVAGFEAVIAHAQADHDWDDAAVAYLNLSIVQRLQEEWDKSEASALGGLSMLERTGEDRGIAADAYEALAATYLMRDGVGQRPLYRTRDPKLSDANPHLRDRDRALENILKAIAMNERLARRSALARNYNLLGLIHRRRFEGDAAEAALLKALAIYEELGVTSHLENEARHHMSESMALVLANLAERYREKRELDKAEASIRRALALYEESGSKEGMAMANAYALVAGLESARREYAKAEVSILKALALHEESGSKEGMAEAYAFLGGVSGLRKEYGRSRWAWQQALTLYRELGMQAKVEELESALAVLARSRP